ncbi:MAG TPA: hypothetical protein VMX11_00190 [Actinomycetes bacterium]|nr:hypothetical protein [Actinomycetes bacterium]
MTKGKIGWHVVITIVMIGALALPILNAWALAVFGWFSSMTRRKDH